jgi:hypothetical protein
MAETKTAKLTIDDKTIELPILSGSTGPDVIDIRKLYAQSGLFTYDPGFTSTAACDSTRITYIDGDEGVLLLPRLSHRAARRPVALPRGLLPADERRPAERAGTRPFRTCASPITR